MLSWRSCACKSFRFDLESGFFIYAFFLRFFNENVGDSVHKLGENGENKKNRDGN